MDFAPTSARPPLSRDAPGLFSDFRKPNSGPEAKKGCGLGNLRLVPSGPVAILPGSPKVAR